MNKYIPDCHRCHGRVEVFLSTKSVIAALGAYETAASKRNYKRSQVCESNLIISHAGKFNQHVYYLPILVQVKKNYAVGITKPIEHYPGKILHDVLGIM